MIQSLITLVLTKSVQYLQYYCKVINIRNPGIFGKITIILRKIHTEWYYHQWWFTPRFFPPEYWRHFGAINGDSRLCEGCDNFSQVVGFEFNFWKSINKCVRDFLSFIVTGESIAQGNKSFGKQATNLCNEHPVRLQQVLSVVTSSQQLPHFTSQGFWHGLTYQAGHLVKREVDR